MAKKYKTNKTGVFYRYTKIEPGIKQYYISFKRSSDKTFIEEKVGSEPDMTAEKAAVHRELAIKGVIPLQRDQNKKILRKKLTIDKLWDLYKIRNKNNNKSLSTDDSYYKNHLKVPFGSKVPSEIKQDQIYKEMDKLLKKLAPASVRKIFGLLIRIMYFGFKNYKCEKFDFIIELPENSEEKTNEFLDSKQRKNLLKCINESDDIMSKAMMKLALFTGMRRGAIFRLRWSDILWESKWIKLRKPKGRKGVKDKKIPLNNVARDLLKNHPKTRGTTLIFVDKNKNKFKRTPKEVYRIRDKAGLGKDFRPFHGLRHAFASMLASSGKVNIFQLRDLLTHKHIAQTMVYAHLLDTDLQKASNVCTDIINKDLGIDHHDLLAN